MPNFRCEPLAIPGLLLIETRRFGDERGFFSETFSEPGFAALGIHATFVQDNHSLSRAAGVVRGLHFQTPPMAQAKLVRVSHGAILDVAVDLRRHSPSFGRHVSAILSAETWNQLFVPVGFAHGFRTLEPMTEVFYKVTRPYSPEHDAGIAWDDPALSIDWGLDPATAILSDKDRALPYLQDLAADLLPGSEAP